MPGDNDETVIYSGNASPAARLVCLDVMLDESLRNLDIRLGVQDESIGRSDDNSITIKYNKMSRHHARISFIGNRWLIEDLNSANGVFVNDQRVNGTSPLGQGDIVIIGQVPFRFEIDTAPPGAAVAPQAAPGNYTGDSGTMYAQHVGVIESLSNPADEPASPPPPPISNKPAAAGKKRPPSQPARRSHAGGSGWLKWLVLLALLLGAAAGYTYYKQGDARRELDEKFTSLNKSVQWFLDKYETENTRTTDTGISTELNDIDRMVRRTDNLLKQAPDDDRLRALKQQLIFLAFEREFLVAIREEMFYDADNLIRDSEAQINAIEVRTVKSRVNYHGLFRLAETVLRFKRFSHQYVTVSTTAPRVPDDYEMQKMQEYKSEFIEQKKINYLILSVTFVRLFEMLEETEEGDMRLLNRWQETLGRG
ncbi:FHA domain-containing protein [Granulosicoccaceae sp. 1_MG-2023]|nr:FHA domain-containing protein [Granulosicoccaceae sp. 1_MG-2023]